MLEIYRWEIRSSLLEDLRGGLYIYVIFESWAVILFVWMDGVDTGEMEEGKGNEERRGKGTDWGRGWTWTYIHRCRFDEEEEMNE